ncbi:cytochrome aa3 quinol oxidase subunit IV [Alkalihalobacillus sp. AL-G]|uniref:cytochrome aa3 quinol oxidase subunit IV n=1 Tax=Alkalihalobacillus sp. AL-G TaxID=2926399 RepID=UPI00272A34DC|nr:cytochrome aa3 quinol oxidase subunit IV [Alkalihalobacillus sp. AL-G]WLD93276.1 cytochrome aa3 quinol oxidase subunit IV [Alkalihalobacillus sp. AL-G]
MAGQPKRLPVKHVIGFILSIALTLLAIWAAFESGLSTKWIIVSIMVLAVIQAGIQLFMFMHMTESESRNGHVPWNMIFHGLVLAAIVVAGSLFTMYSGHGSGDHGGDQQHEQKHGGHNQH